MTAQDPRECKLFKDHCMCALRGFVGYAESCVHAHYCPDFTPKTEKK